MPVFLFIRDKFTFSLQNPSFSEVMKKGQKSPYILLSGSKDQLQSFLVVDKTLVCECPLDNIPLILLSSFFSFNICYTPGCNKYFSFLEHVFLDYKSKLPASVKHLIASLSCPGNTD